jgi:hypothetical protein
MTLNLKYGYIENVFDDKVASALIDSDLLNNKFVLISKIDSCQRSAVIEYIHYDLSKITLQKIDIGALTPRSDGTIMPYAVFSELVKLGIFNCFDEFWIFDSIPDAEIPVFQLSSEMRITAPYYYKELLHIQDWFSLSKCEFAIGTGSGINYLARDGEIESKILELFYE